MHAKHLLPSTDAHFVTERPQTYKWRGNINVVRNVIFHVLIVLFGTLPPIYGQDLKLEWAKMNASKGGNNTGVDHIDVATDPQNNVVVSGIFTGRVNLNPAKPGTAEFRERYSGVFGDAYAAKYTEKGEYIWAIQIESARSVNGPTTTIGWGVTTDKFSNVLLVGQFSDKIDFDPGPGNAPLSGPQGYLINDQCGFVAKYDSNGKYIWGLAIGSDSSIHELHKRYVFCREVATDQAGNVFVTGSIAGKVDFDPGPDTAFLTLDSNQMQDAFLAKYDVDGKFKWVKRLGGNGKDNRGLSVAIDTQNNVYFGGWMTETTGDLGSGKVLTSLGGQDGFLIKYDNNGGLLWATEIGGAFTDYVNCVTTDSEGNVYAGGSFNNVVDFDPGPSIYPVSSSGGNDAFVAKYDKTGSLKWALGMGGASHDEAWGTAVDALGNVLVTGYFQGTADFDPGAGVALLRPYGNSSASIGSLVFMAKYDANGNYKWCGRNGTYQPASPVAEIGRQVAVDKKNGIYFTGALGGNSGRLNIGDLDPGPDTIRVDFVGYCGYLVKFGCGDTSSTYLTINECSDHFNFRGEVFTENGVYTRLVTSRHVCDSIFILDLRLIALEKPIITVDVYRLGTLGTYNSYQWLKNGTPIPGAIHKNLTVTENANYEVIVTNEFGCESKSEIYKVTNVTAIDDINGRDKGIHIYPNPTAGFIIIDAPLSFTGALWTLDGRKVMNIGPNEKLISVHHITKGIYLLRLVNQEGETIKLQKILKM